VQHPVKQFVIAGEIEFFHRRAFMRVHRFDLQLHSFGDFHLTITALKVMQHFEVVNKNWPQF
jgi:hypothetical protein